MTEADGMELHRLRGHELRGLLDRGEVTSVDIVQSLLERIDAIDDDLGSYLALRPEEAIAEAKEADRRIQQGEDVSPLTGIPVSVKDNLCTKGTLTTCASKMLANFRPPYDATVVAALKAQGAPIVGKLNMDEFAMGSSNETSAMKPARNPWDPTRAPGGSSGGSAAAVAAGTATMALGSDTGGSIRQPASFCGVVGVKPTYGLVSRYGLIPFAPSLDQVGPLAQDVRDACLLLQAIAGWDELDSTSLEVEIPDYQSGIEAGVKGMKIGLPEELFGDGIASDVKETVLKAVQALEEQGAEVREISLRHAKAALACFHVIASAEASSSLARYDGVRYGFRADDAADVITMFTKTRGEGFGAEVKRRILLGTWALSAGQYEDVYVRALKARTLIRGDFLQAFAEVDLLASPTSPTTAFPIGEKAADPRAMHLADICTVAANLAGVPALSVPCGLDRQGLPVGLQLMGPALSEAALLRAAFAVERAVGLTPHKPEVEVGSWRPQA